MDPPADPELLAQVERLRALSRPNRPATAIAALGLFGLNAFYPNTVLAVMASLVSVSVLLQARSAWLNERHDVQGAVTYVSFAIWVPMAGMAVIMPQIFPVTVVLTLFSVMVALPYVEPRRVVWLSAVATGLLVLGSVFFVLPPILPLDVPDFVVRLVLSVGTVVCGALSLYAVWQSIGRLHDKVLETKTANDALRESERTLERRVETRTADLVESQRELALARDEAIDANRSKSAFLANMSHELRTPLNAIIGYAEMLQEDAEEADQAELVPDLEKIRGAGRHLLGLINDVLDLSKVESGRTEIFAEDFDVADMLRETTATIVPLVEQHENTLVVEGEAGAGSMHSDITKIRQVLLNLLSNAAKFTEGGAITLSVERTATGGQDWLNFKVRDSGIGMTPEQLDHVFEAFEQADASVSKNYGGTGLGLAISRRFCEMLGGEVTVTSELGQGSEFLVRLPARAPEIQPAETEPAAEEGTSSESGELSNDAPTVLVIDDDGDARDLLERSLTRDGYRVVTSSRGEGALELVRRIRPAVITLDVQMPDMDGWSVLSALKSDPSVADIPVVLVTILEDRNLGYALGATEYLTKPVDRARLLSVVERYAQRSASVLVVDDDEGTRSLIARTIAKAGLQVTEAANGRVALESLASQLPALVLLDLMMPEMDGFEFLRVLRDEPRWAEIPVVVVTAKELTASERALLAGEAQQVLQKGAYTRDQLVGEVRRLVRGHESGN